MLLAGTGLMMRSFLTLYEETLVVDASDLFATSVRAAGERYATQEQRRAFYGAVEERLAARGEIAEATISSTLPFSGGYPRSLAIDGRPVPEDEPLPNVTYLTIGNHYFETLGLRLLAGRFFTALDGTPGHDSAIVNQRFVDQFFPHEEPLGRRIRLTNTNVFADMLSWLTIVGVTPTVRQAPFSSDADPVVYVPFRADSGYFAGLIVRPRTDVASAATAIREEFAALDPDMPLFDVTPLEQVMAGSRGFQRSILMMMSVFAVMALILASASAWRLAPGHHRSCGSWHARGWSPWQWEWPSDWRGRPSWVAYSGACLSAPVRLTR
jgi:hypothetical protein